MAGSLQFPPRKGTLASALQVPSSYGWDAWPRWHEQSCQFYCWGTPLSLLMTLSSPNKSPKPIIPWDFPMRFGRGDKACACVFLRAGGLLFPRSSLLLPFWTPLLPLWPFHVWDSVAVLCAGSRAGKAGRGPEGPPAAWAAGRAGSVALALLCWPSKGKSRAAGAILSFSAFSGGMTGVGPLEEGRYRGGAYLLVLWRD